MNITLEIDDDVLQAAKELALHEGGTVGEVISRLTRKGLQGAIGIESSLVRNGVPVLPPRGEIITLEHVQRILNPEED